MSPCGGHLLAGRHVRALGNTPGHHNHWSTRGFRRFVSSVAEIREVRTPLPWTIAWATLDQEARRPAETGN